MYASQQPWHEWIHAKARQLWQVLSPPQAGNSQEDSLHGKDHPNEGETEDQIHQLGNAAPVGSSCLQQLGCLQQNVIPKIRGN